MDGSPRRREKKNRLRPGRWILAVLCLAAVLPYALHRPPPLPPGVDTRGEARAVTPGSLQLLYDITALDPATGERVIRQEIFDAALQLIDEARRFVYLDFFLWNTWQGPVPEEHRRIATELAEALIAKRKASPETVILAMTDPINRVYGRHEDTFFAGLADAGIPVVFTDLDRLPDSNLLYAAPARFWGSLLARWPAASRGLNRPLWPNPLIRQGPRLSTRQLARLFFFKANHRKLLVADSANGTPRLLVTSLNPADGSSAHGNIALLAEGPVAADALHSELKVLDWSAERPGGVLEVRPGDWRAARDAISATCPPAQDSPAPETGHPFAAWDSEEAILRRMLRMVDDAGPGDEILGAVFYLSERRVVRALRGAARRGARVRLILDPNKDAFGRPKNGIPNRPVAAELMRAATREGLPIEIRWAATHGEQFHGKALAVRHAQAGRQTLTAGSANWTRRNLRNLNLEANLFVSDEPESLQTFLSHFETAWSNGDGLLHTEPYPRYAERGWSAGPKTILYRLQERWGAGTF